MDGKLVSSDMCITWGTIKYGCIPVPGLFHMIMEVWESPMHVAVIRCVLNQRQSMLHVLDFFLQLLSALEELFKVRPEEAYLSLCPRIAGE